MKNVLYIVCLLSAGCSQKSALDESFKWDSGSDPVNEGTDTTDSDTSESAPEPNWWALGSSFTIAKGVPLIGGELLITPHDDVGEPICALPEPIAITAVTEEIAPYDVMLTWWRLELDVPDEVCDGVATPIGSVLYLGVGEMHPDITAAIVSIDGLDDTLPLNGAYASLDGDEVFVFGVAGLEEAYIGDGEVAEAAPLQDGSWLVEPVYWFAF